MAGADPVIALAPAAHPALVGRPYLYGLAAGGERGVGPVITRLGDEMKRTMRLWGVRRIAEPRPVGARLVSLGGESASPGTPS